MTLSAVNLNFRTEYLAALITAFAAGAALYCFNNRAALTKKNFKPLFASAACMAAALLGAWVFGYITVPAAHGRPFLQTAVLSFQYFYCMAFFATAAAIVFPLFNLDISKELNAIVPSFALFGAIAKIGCSVAGCCGGITVNGVTVPTAEIESAAGFVLFALFQFAFKKNRGRNFLLTYAVFRFVMEFLRVNTGTALLFNVFSPVQWIAAVMITVIVINLKSLRQNKTIFLRRNSYENTSNR